MAKMPQVIPHSGPQKLLKHNATRKSMASPDKPMVTPHSGSRSDVMGNDGIGKPYAKASDRMEQKFTNKMTATPHSPVAVPREPRAFRNKKLPMGVPVTMPNE